jgi:hypothetical protein
MSAGNSYSTGVPHVHFVSILICFRTRTAKPATAGCSVDEDLFFFSRHFPMEGWHCAVVLNAGNNSYVTKATDLDGNPRISGVIVDIGAYEFQWPQLTIAPSGSNVLVTWPTNNAGYDYAGFTLQSTTNLASPVWSANSPAPVVVNGENVVTNPISGARQLFRLRH